MELECTVTPSGSEIAVWIINHMFYTAQQLRHDILTGYSTNGNNLTIENIMMNDGRNDTEYQCGTISSTANQPTEANIVDKSHPILLYIAGESV